MLYVLLSMSICSFSYNINDNAKYTETFATEAIHTEIHAGVRCSRTQNVAKKFYINFSYVATFMRNGCRQMGRIFGRIESEFRKIRKKCKQKK